MNEIKQIRSVQNTLVKKVIVLKEKSRERKKTGLFIIEGLRELQLSLKGGYRLDTILFYGKLISKERVLDIINNSTNVIDVVEISKEVYQKIAYRETTEGVLAISRSKDHALGQLAITNDNPLVLVAEAPEKPGNIGALLRTADAANVDAVIIANPKTDIYNPNIIRSSIGCVFTAQIATGSTNEVLAFLKERSIAVYCAALSASENYVETDFTGPAAIVVGTEASGLSDKWLQNSQQNIIIPMQGEIDSMNVSVSAAILIFEAKRQRGFR